MAVWASADDVNTLLGVTVDDATRNIAANVIGLKCGLIEDVERTDMSDRDAYWLKLAVCYQAAWLAAQPDFLERSTVTNASQDGQSASFGPDALELAPLARVALKRLSWRGNRVVGGNARAFRPNALISDEHGGWRPL
jgi:hypothetical protein